jgi:hypothetical protein
MPKTNLGTNLGVYRLRTGALPTAWGLLRTTHPGAGRGWYAGLKRGLQEKYSCSGNGTAMVALRWLGGGNGLAIYHLKRHSLNDIMGGGKEWARRAWGFLFQKQNKSRHPSRPPRPHARNARGSPVSPRQTARSPALEGCSNLPSGHNTPRSS